MRRLTARDLEVLGHLARFRYLNSVQVEGFLFDGSTVRPHSREVLSRRILASLRRRGLVAATARAVGGIGGGSVRSAYFLTEAGRSAVVEVAAGSVPPCPRGGRLVEHALATADVALSFRRSADARTGHELSTWECDWEVARTLGPSLVRPDARLAYLTETWELDAFVEIDRGTERPAAFAAKVAAYLALYRSGAWRERLAVWPLILTVTPTVVRAAALRRTVELVLSGSADGAALGCALEFRFASLAHVLEAEGPLGEIWQVAGRVGLHRLVAAEAAEGIVGDRGASSTFEQHDERDEQRDAQRRDT